MLEHYFLRPATVDRIRANVAGAYIEHYVCWLRAQGYADRNVLKRVPILCQFGEFASARGATDGQTAFDHVEPFAQHWQSIHGKSGKTHAAREKVACDARNPTRQMLELALLGNIRSHRQRKPFPFEAEVPLPSNTDSNLRARRFVASLGDMATWKSRAVCLAAVVFMTILRGSVLATHAENCDLAQLLPHNWRGALTVKHDFGLARVQES